ncbi:hypothetical protein J2Z62_000365 [Mycoplasmoides fastidiosum]|uniref:Uncharacterized protein n=1 Tax=Mycoplasmoides fastidiosum TaxID=92758 RepID=A0ABU0LYZ4_9BACT|nr:hypothetical protein [Mycoplasmoides fastidiosum]MDQ0513927.1 hypothetical protein [Mycoplasmoides fastidiosum]UUD37659.1 hypothetical protein NPA10_03770 [Mycoplasmoides fastidiosum]
MSKDNAGKKFAINPNFNLETLVKSAPPGIVAQPNKSYRNLDDFQLVWKDETNKIQADSYNYFFSDQSTIIANNARDKEYAEILKEIKTNSEVTDELVAKLKAIAKKHYANPISSVAEPQIAIVKIPFLEAVNKLLQQELVDNSQLFKSKSVKEAIKNIINQITALDPYLVSTSYPWNSNQFGKNIDGKYSSELDERKSSYTTFIAPQIDFSKLSFPDAGTILSEIILYRKK